MTPEPTFTSSATVELPLYYVELPVIPLLLAVLVILGIVLVVRRRSSLR